MAKAATQREKRPVRKPVRRATPTRRTAPARRGSDARRGQLSPWTYIAVAAGLAYVGVYLVGHFLVLADLFPKQMGDLTVAVWRHVAEMVAVVFAAALMGARQSLVAEAAAMTSVSAGHVAVVTSHSDIVTMDREPEEVIQDLTLLYEIGQGLSATINLPELLERVTALLQRHVTVREFAILLFDEDRQFLQVRAASGFDDVDRVKDMIFQAGEGVSGVVAQSGKQLYVKDTAHDERYLQYRGELQKGGALLSVALRYKQEVLGVINFGRHGIDSFSSHDMRLLNLVANQIALAIANARLYGQTRELAVRDDLTGLYNRRHFHEVAQIEWKRAVRFKRPLSVLMVDCDHFKSLNDRFGHLHGDKVLRQVSDILRRNLREVDTLARFGGEEFVVLLPDTDKVGALHVAQKLRSLVERERFPVPQGGEVHPLTISIGVSVFPNDAKQIEDLIDHADIALYDAKDHGRNRVISYPEATDDAEESKGPRLVL